MPAPDLHLETIRKTGLGILCGRGDIPVALAEFCQQQNIPYQCICLMPFADERLYKHPHLKTKLENIREILQYLKNHDIRHIVMIGGIKRPSIWSLCKNIFSIMFLLKSGFMKKGDNGLLTIASAMLENQGFQVHGIQEFLPALTAPEGLLTNKQDLLVYNDRIKSGIKAAFEHGQNDLGQSIIIQKDGLILREDEQGTDALINRAEPEALLVKLAKPQQDKRLDLPTIGLKTVELCETNGVCGIIIEAGKTLIVDQEKTIKKANEASIFIKSINKEKIRQDD